MYIDTIFLKKIFKALLILFFTPIVFGQNITSEKEVESFHVQGNVWLLQERVEMSPCKLEMMGF